MTIETKAIALLTEGRVQITFAGEQFVRARIRGDHGIYDTQWHRNTGWSCSCAAHGECSHRRALGLVTMHSVGRLLDRTGPTRVLKVSKRAEAS